MRYRYDYEEFQIEIVSREEERRLFSDQYLLLYMVSGEAVIGLDGESNQLEEGDCFPLNNGREATLTVSPKGIRAQITFSPKLLRGFFPGQQVVFSQRVIRGGQKDSPDISGCDAAADFGGARKQTDVQETQGKIVRKGNISLQESAAHRLTELVKKILDTSLNLPKGGRSVQITALFYQLLEILTDNFRVSEDAMEATETGQDWKDAVAQWIGLHYSEPIDLKQVAEKCFISYYQLSRSFKTIFGRNFYEYLNDIRMRHVLSDLMEGKKKMTDVALDNGYGSAAAFTRSFHKQFGMAPKEYRKEMIRRGQKTRMEQERDRYVALPVKQEPDVRQVSAHAVLRGDVQNAQPFVHPFTKMINAGYAADLLRADMQRSILQLKRELKFPYIRFFNPFCEEMELRKDHETDNLNFSRLDEILDFFVDNGIRPWIDFGDKPKLVCDEMITGESLVNKQSREGKPVFRRKSEFQAVLEAFTDHIVRRYGREETAYWMYEFWDDFYRPDRQRGGEIVSFFDAFDTAVSVIKKRIPTAMVGGGGRALMMTEEKFLGEWSRHCPPDFVSTIQYPYQDPLYEDAREAGKYDMSVDLFPRYLDEARQLMNKNGMTGKLFVSEFSADVSARNFQNDSCYQAAWCLRNAVAVIGKVDVAGYWCGSDCSFLASDSGRIFGGSGVITRDGIRKPVFYALSFLQNLDRYLIGCDEHGVLTASGSNSYTAVLYNYQVMDYAYYLKNEVHTDVEQHVNQTETGMLMQKIIIKNVAPGNYRCHVFRIGPDGGSLLEEWAKLEFEQDLTRGDVTYLERISTPRVSVEHLVAAEQLEIEVMLEKQEIMMIKIERESVKTVK